MEEINNPPPSLLRTSSTNSRHSLYDSPLPPWTVEISSVGEVWFFFGMTQEYSPFYMTTFSLTNFICQMFFDRIN